MATETETIEWLVDGDPAIRWQVMRDLLDEPADVWEPERHRTVDDGRVQKGRWPLQERIPVTLLVEMERPGQESRWNTLRALRMLKARSTRPYAVG
jgi:hypothetical protein